MDKIHRTLTTHSTFLMIATDPKLVSLNKFKSTVYFEPTDEIHAFVGDLIMKGTNIKLIPFTEEVRIPDSKCVHFFTTYNPEVHCYFPSQVTSCMRVVCPKVKK